MKKLAALLFVLCLTFSSVKADRGAPQIEATYSARTAVIRCAGDFVIHDNLLASALKDGGGSHDFSLMLSEVAEYLGDADYTFTNVDGVMGTDEFVKRYGYGGYPSFSTPANLIYNLKDIGVDLLTLANNHALDYWYDGLISTVTSVKNAGVTNVGGYRSREEKDTPVIAEINGIRFGFLNYTDGLNQMDKRSRLDKAALEYGVDFLPKAHVSADINRLKTAGAEVIVCYMHWGIEYRTEPCKSQLENDKMLANLGVDVIIGGGPHMVQRAEYIVGKDGDGNPKRVLCLYSLGNFLSDQRSQGRDSGIIFDFTVTRDEDGTITVSDPCYRTTWVWRRQNGLVFEYKVLFSDDESPKPADMSNADFKRMNESSVETISRMDAGCAAHKMSCQDAIVYTPNRNN